MSAEKNQKKILIDPNAFKRGLLYTLGKLVLAEEAVVMMYKSIDNLDQCVGRRQRTWPIESDFELPKPLSEFDPVVGEQVLKRFFQEPEKE